MLLKCFCISLNNLMQSLGTHSRRDKIPLAWIISGYPCQLKVTQPKSGAYSRKLLCLAMAYRRRSRAWARAARGARTCRATAGRRTRPSWSSRANRRPAPRSARRDRTARRSAAAPASAHDAQACNVKPADCHLVSRKAHSDASAQQGH